MVWLHDKIGTGCGSSSRGAPCTCTFRAGGPFVRARHNKRSLAPAVDLLPPSQDLPKKSRLVVVGVAQRGPFLRCACALVSLIPKAPDRPNRGPPSGLPCLHCASPLKGAQGRGGGPSQGNNKRRQRLVRFAAEDDAVGLPCVRRTLRPPWPWPGLMKDVYVCDPSQVNLL